MFNCKPVETTYGIGTKCTSPWGSITFSPNPGYSPITLNWENNDNDNQTPPHAKFEDPDSISSQIEKEVTTEEGPGFKRVITKVHDKRTGKVTIMTKTHQNGKVKTERKVFEDRPLTWTEWLVQKAREEWSFY